MINYGECRAKKLKKIAINLFFKTLRYVICMEFVSNYLNLANIKSLLIHNK